MRGAAGKRADGRSGIQRSGSNRRLSGAMLTPHTWLSGACLIALTVTSASAAISGAQGFSPAFVSSGTLPGSRTRPASSLRVPLPALSARSLKAWGRDHTRLQLGRQRRTRRQATGAAAAVAEADGEAKVWDEVVTEGEHQFKRVVMEVDVGGKMLRLETGEIGRLAAGAVIAKQGESVVYSTACGDLDLNKEEVIEDFVPMSVHYQVLLYCVGSAPANNLIASSLKRSRKCTPTVQWMTQSVSYVVLEVYLLYHSSESNMQQNHPRSSLLQLNHVAANSHLLEGTHSLARKCTYIHDRPLSCSHDCV